MDRMKCMMKSKDSYRLLVEATYVVNLCGVINFTMLGLLQMQNDLVFLEIPELVQKEKYTVVSFICIHIFLYLVMYLSAFFTSLRCNEYVFQIC
jgi:hypothetical protein